MTGMGNRLQAGSTAGLHIVCMPDSFKGSLNAPDVAKAMAQGVRKIFGEAVSLSVLPFSDGGEGALNILVSALDGELHSVDTVDALGRNVTSQIGFYAQGRAAVIEAAEANGITQVADVRPQPLHASSHGVGILVKTALDVGVNEILLCLGGSASVDGGIGLLSVLGAEFLDDDGQPVPHGGQGLSEVASIDLSKLHPRARDISWRIATDVTNPLVGPSGAAVVFGPQKGATSADVSVLDSGLRNLANEVARFVAQDTYLANSVEFSCVEEILQKQGFGAAGGIPATIVPLLNAEIVSGADIIAQTIDLRSTLRSASLIFTGEGKLDRQSLEGKAISSIRHYAPTDTPIFAVAGSVELTFEECQGAGISAALSISPGARTIETLMNDPSALISESVAHICSVYLHGLHRTGKLY